MECELIYKYLERFSLQNKLQVGTAFSKIQYNYVQQL
jgi:hypothetical protein